MRKALCWLVELTLAVVLSGCATPAKVAQIEEKQVIDVPSGVTAKPIQFKKIVVKLPRGQKIGAIQGGLLAVPMGDLTWQGGRLQLSGDEFTDVFRDELQKANYAVVGDPNALFDDPSSWKAELLVAGLVKDMKANVCYPWAGYGNYSTAKGEAYLSVEWQVYSRLDRQVVLTIATEGSARVKKATNTGGQDIFLNAFAAAVRNLLADAAFNKLVTSSEPLLSQPLPEQLRIPKLAALAGKLEEHVSQVGDAVVTVFAGDGHGSGFFIDANGHAITNAHVVGEAKHVKVKFGSGKEVLGEVVRSNKRRDVALLKVADVQVAPLPIRTTAAQVAEEVFAIGSPLDEKLSTTVSKGVVSAFREQDGMSFIQSDTNILPGNSGGPLVDTSGNVLAITVAGYFALGVAPEGVNFFIPIMDALKDLSIVVEGT